MATGASILAPASRSYRGDTTDPYRWVTWVPRKGDILVCTPAKCGTTWTQTILAMLLHGGPDLPEKVPVLSPWIDADLGVPASEVATALARQQGRRVVKTHTPADGFPLWQGVIVIAVYRHPLDVFFSLRKHAENVKDRSADHPMLMPISHSIREFLEGPSDINDCDRDTLAAFVEHYSQTALSGRVPEFRLFHYSDMLRNRRAAVERLAKAAEIDASAALLDAVTEASAFGAMKKKAANYAPVAGTGYWKSDAGFFDSASSNKWEGKLTEAEIELYHARLAHLIPDYRARIWLENGDR